MKVRSVAMFWFVILFVCITILAPITPPNPDTLHSLHISASVYHFIILTLLLPYGLIWFAAFYGYDQMQRYAHALRRTGEGKAFKKIADGLRIFAWGLMLTTILGLILSFIDSVVPSLVPAQAIINHYAALALAIVAFTLIGDGTYMLAELVHGKRSKASIRVITIIAAIVGILFARFVVINRSSGNNPYYLSIYPLLLTIVVPYIYAWTIGAIATAELRMYAQQVTGVLYKGAVQGLANGLTIVIITSIATQYVTAAFTQNLNQSLGSLLAVVYVLLAVEALGFVMVALGAKRMRRIEEV